MSRRLLSSCTRIMSPVCRRRTPSAPATLGHAVQMSSSSKDDPPQPPKAATKKKPSISKEPEPTVVEKGDTYKAGESYFSYHPYSFYDIENQMQPHRLKQPCSGDKAS